MAVNTYACGTRPCVEVLQTIFVNLGWQTIGLVIILFIFVPNVLVALYKILCGRSLTTRECAIFRQNERYGLDAYSPAYFQVSSQNRHCTRWSRSDTCLKQDLQSYRELEKDNSLRNRHTLSTNEVKMV